ncbi:MAG: tetratricopeptide repeat protein [Treponema sp.]|nr:tetratricopeptide repeat protein [Treponema sp.]
MAKFDFKTFWNKVVYEVKHFWNFKLTNKQKKIVCGGAAVLVLLLIILCARGCSSGKSRNNTLSIVQMYYQKGEYDRALDKLEQLLQKNPTDKKLIALMDEIIAAKAKNKDSQGGGSGFDGNVNVNVDTDGLQSSLESMKEELLRNNQAMKDQLALTNAEAEKNRREMQELLKQQKEQAELEKARQEENRKQQKALEEKRAKEEAIAKAAEEKRQKEEARKAAEKKAAEEALAKKNAALKKEMNAVNDEIQQGKVGLGTGNYNGAIEHFEKARTLLPVSDGEPAFSANKYSEMASALYDASQSAASPEDKKKLMSTAVIYAQEAINKEPKDASSQYILAMDAYEKKDWPKAAEYLSKAVAYDGKNYLYYYNLGRVQYMMKKFTEAKQSFTTACQLNNVFAPARYNLGLTNLRLNDSKSALAEFRRAHDIDTRYEKAYLEEGRVLYRLGDYSGSVTAYLNVVRINNTNREALKELGSAYYQMNKFAEAENAFRQSLALLPAGTEDPLTNYNLSTVLYEQKKTVDALNYAKKAYDSYGIIRDSNSKANIIYNYALLLDKSGKTLEAISKYSEVLQIKSDHLKTLTNLGVMYMNSTPQDTDMALSMFERAYALDKNNFEVNNNLGSAYLSKKDYKNAVTYFQNALRLDPKNNDVRYNLAQAFASDGQFDNAKTTYIELLRMKPDCWDAYVELGKVCLTLQDNEGAEKYLITVQTKQPSFRKSEVDMLLSSLKN